jgi:hypothetical protein
LIGSGGSAADGAGEERKCQTAFAVVDCTVLLRLAPGSVSTFRRGDVRFGICEHVTQPSAATPTTDRSGGYGRPPAVRRPSRRTPRPTDREELPHRAGRHVQQPRSVAEQLKQDLTAVGRYGRSAHEASASRRPVDPPRATGEIEHDEPIFMAGATPIPFLVVMCTLVMVGGQDLRSQAISPISQSRSARLCGFRKFWAAFSGNSDQVSRLI